MFFHFFFFYVIPNFETNYSKLYNVNKSYCSSKAAAC